MVETSNFFPQKPITLTRLQQNTTRPHAAHRMLVKWDEKFHKKYVCCHNSLWSVWQTDLLCVT